MIDTMEHDDRIVVERLYAALDEVASTEQIAPARRTRTGRTSPTWLAVASVTALVAGGGWWALARRGPTDTGRGNRDGDRTAPATAVNPTQDGLPATTSADERLGVPTTSKESDQRTWYSLISPDLFPQQAIQTVWCSTYPFPGPATSVAWTIDTGGFGGDPGAITAILAMTATPASSTAPMTTISVDEPVVTRRQPDGSTWTFTSFGLTAAERDRLIDQVVPAPASRRAPRSVGIAARLRRRRHRRSGRQEYLGAAGSVQLSVGDYQGELTGLTDATTTATPVTIAGSRRSSSRAPAAPPAYGTLRSVRWRSSASHRHMTTGWWG